MDAEVRGAAETQAGDASLAWRRYLPSAGTAIVMVFIVLVLALLQGPFEFQGSTRHFFCRGGFPAISYAQYEFRTPAMTLADGEAATIQYETLRSPWGYVINLTFTLSVCAILWLVSLARRRERYSLKAVFALMFLFSLTLGMAAIARAHNAHLEDRARSRHETALDSAAAISGRRLANSRHFEF